MKSLRNLIMSSANDAFLKFCRVFAKEILHLLYFHFYAELIGCSMIVDGSSTSIQVL